MSWHTTESGCCVGRGCLGPDPSEAPHVGGFRSWQSGLVPPPSQDQGSGRHWGRPRAKHGAPPSGPGHGPVGGALGGQQGALGHGQSRGSTSQAGQGQAGLVVPSGPRHGVRYFSVGETLGALTQFGRASLGLKVSRAPRAVRGSQLLALSRSSRRPLKCGLAL